MVRLKNILVWAFHGDIDTIVPLKNSSETVDAVNNIGGNCGIRGQGYEKHFKRKIRVRLNVK